MPGEGFVLDIVSGRGAVGIKAHTRDGGFALLFGEEGGVAGCVGEEPTCDQTENDGDGAL